MGDDDTSKNDKICAKKNVNYHLWRLEMSMEALWVYNTFINHSDPIDSSTSAQVVIYIFFYFLQ